MKHIFRLSVLLSALLAALLLASCGGEAAPETTSAPDSGALTDAPQTSPATEAQTEAVTEPPSLIGTQTTYSVIHKEVYNAALDWNRQKQSIAGTSDSAWWNITGCVKMGINFLNVFPNYRENDTSIAGAALIGTHGQSICDYTAPGLAASHKNGMKVVTSLPMCLLNMASYKSFGTDYLPLASRKSDGSVSAGSDSAYACINNPLFQDMVRSYSVTCAKAGYDGMFYDANPYAYGVKFNCCCQYCKDGWKAYSLAQTGAEIKLPTADPTLTGESGRLFWKWRLDIYIDFLLDVQKECRQYNPAFSVWPNTGFNGTTLMYYTLKGLEDAMCEYGANTVVEPGVESTLYAFAQWEAMNPEKQFMTQFNNISTQASPDYKWYTAYAEAIAGNGSLMAPTSSKGTTTFFSFINGCNKIKDAEPEAFSDSASAADVAIVCSWQNINAYTFKKTGTIPYVNNSPRKVAGVLASLGIPFDYVMPENTTALDAIAKYRTIILPDLKLLDKDFAALLQTYLQEGGQVLILGSFASNYVATYGISYPAWETDVLEDWCGTKYASFPTGSTMPVGKGKVCVVKSYITGSAEKVAKPSAEFSNAIHSLGIDRLVSLSGVTLGKVETTLRSDASGSRWWLHLITYGSEGKYQDAPLTVTVTVPAGQTVTAVTGLSPTVTSSKMQLTWKQEGDKLTVSLVPGIYTMLKIEKK